MAVSPLLMSAYGQKSNIGGFLTILFIILFISFSLIELSDFQKPKISKNVYVDNSSKYQNMKIGMNITLSVEASGGKLRASESQAAWANTNTPKAL